MSPPPAKRQRTEDVSITRSNIWFKDGSIVLQAENIQFRVHWSILALHSPFFADLENLPQPPDQPAIDGCPVVPFHDSAVDLQYLLDAIYDPYVYLVFDRQTTLPLAAVGAMIRLGRKYDFKSFLDSAMKRFTSQAPTTLAEYEVLFATGSYPTRITSESRRFPSQFLKLAQENNILSALPVAYLHAAQLDIVSLVRSFQHHASIVADFQTDSDTLKRCLIGREILLTKQFQPGYPMGWLVQCRCPDSSCATFRKIEFRGYMEEKLVNAFKLSKLDTAHWEDSLCDSCYQDALEYNDGRKKMWEELPGIFNLPEWDQLTNDI
ncbi:hypothetical protein C8R45DRAFT_865579 [Mycena sanguinolenta]|nr:hypothetical protein C8R45DRAFT_865579 [Mycena sanguinolenta]